MEKRDILLLGCVIVFPHEGSSEVVNYTAAQTPGVSIDHSGYGSYSGRFLEERGLVIETPGVCAE